MIISMQILHHIWWGICPPVWRTSHLLGILALLLTSHCRSYPPSAACLIRDIMANIFPKILVRSSIRPDLVECLRTPTLAAVYLKEDLITAITRYISVSNFIGAHPHALPFLRGLTVVKIPPNSCRMSNLR
jgi:hypothetical protein